MQLYAGIAVISALFKIKHAPRSNIIIFLLLHAFVLEATNVVGFITAIVEFMWCLGPLSASKLDSPILPNDLRAQWNRLYITSNVAFILSGLLTDGILVRVLG